MAPDHVDVGLTAGRSLRSDGRSEGDGFIRQRAQRRVDDVLDCSVPSWVSDPRRPHLTLQIGGRGERGKASFLRFDKVLLNLP